MIKQIVTKLVVIFFFCFLFSWADIVNAEKLEQKPAELFPSDGLRGKIEFWKLVFTKYGKNQLVFHHREYPEIIYSVLDLRKEAEQLSPREFERKQNELSTAEVKRIQVALKSLAEGKHTNSPFESRLKQIFHKVGIDQANNYLEALAEDQIRSQTGIKERFREGLSRSGRYLKAIENIFISEGLPPELARLPLIESSFDYKAYSSVGAAGIWQFMRSTGKNYMRISAAIDERRDPIISSRAAAHYLAHSYEVTKSWPLAVTSYNHGLAGIMRGAKEVGSDNLAIIIANYNKKSFGFASKNFYAEFLAAVEVEQNYKKYFPDLRKEQRWHFDEVKLSSHTSFKNLLRASELSKEELLRINTALLEPVISRGAAIPSGFVVKVSRQKGDQLVKNLSSGMVLSIDGANKEFLASLDRKKQVKRSGLKKNKKSKSLNKRKKK